ncbi:Protein of unknown function DUF669 [uncultured Caudovirales phage]|uniref:Uncharacterized protein n=2 Tax=root TaxID=1 RepID=A0A6J5Q6X4_9CAUD|nr:Protein of unknown function DUF669 [uncultured Caudovirales phage]CAB4171267.1 Protein of unknown function DUF669 [uncultured Caudovirales phage]CAB4177231.1 Protein of unknown function DUF669 [uncultured Caudovirales phage]CAB4182850.1 Protein of unknown function DUF669 [uncultured Caudovirales phage]CAB4187530.1 Protein of unknown function DUF669 [uncultured Caudovirales phage]
MPVIYPDTTQMVEMGPIEPGTYPATITAVEGKTSKEKGTPMIVCDFDIVVGDATRKRKSYIVISGAGAFSFDQILRATGFENVAEQIKNGEKVPFDTDAMIGQELLVVIDKEVRRDNGELSDKIKTYMKK